ncbi:hypothetical protein jhhlp_002663 [Lomentospora prolificans]|uniref:DUF1996 domain-containing protein n=1 Tax=Lomentospora prolificans TaxID=41688 RepID=A0A2N3NEP6_9PEZI|nr:hypothetical protein jhhlp_002663 [Lomentospora prolificans]
MYYLSRLFGLALLGRGILAQDIITAFTSGCSQLVLDRIDPLVSPGEEPSSHAHQIAGGNSFQSSMPPVRFDPASESTCTSCNYLEDASNYWTPLVYFQARNGSFKRVPQKPPVGFDEYASGTRIYYYGTYNDDRPTAFPKGFRMQYGNLARHGIEKTSKFQGMGYQCVDMGEVQGAYTQHFPTTPCQYGIVTSVWFPPCWDGVRVDSDDHMSHMAFPSTGSIEDGAPCPESHPVQVPHMYLDSIWDTSEFNDPELWPEDPEKQPFVLSNGDSTGYDFYASFLNGWKDGALERALAEFGTECDMRALDSCLGFNQQNRTDSAACTKKPVIDEDLGGWLDELPGGVQVY